MIECSIYEIACKFDILRISKKTGEFGRKRNKNSFFISYGIFSGIANYAGMCYDNSCQAVRVPEPHRLNEEKRFRPTAKEMCYEKR